MAPTPDGSPIRKVNARGDRSEDFSTFPEQVLSSLGGSKPDATLPRGITKMEQLHSRTLPGLDSSKGI